MACEPPSCLPSTKRENPMRPNNTFFIVAALLVAMTIIFVPSNSQSNDPASGGLASVSSSSPNDFNQHCTVFYAADDKVAIGGNNEDSFNPRTKIWFLPPEEGNYGVAYVGYEDYVAQGGVNDHGLFFDGLAVRVVNVPQAPGKPTYPGVLMLKAMRECATVSCALQLFDQYSLGPGTFNGQYLVGDGTGDAAIIEPLAVVRKQGQYQVATNFFQSEVPPEARTDTRYRTAMEMFKQAKGFSVDLFRNILNATHQEGSVHTLYSTVYDLKQGVIYLYYFHDFDHVVVLNLKDELAKGIHDYDIPALFPPSPAALLYGKSVSDKVATQQAKLGGEVANANLLADYVGRYQLTPVEYADIKNDGDKLLARTSYLPWLEIYPESDTRFARVVSNGDGDVAQVELSFLRDQTGKVTSLEYSDASGSKLVANKTQAPATTSESLTSAYSWLLLPIAGLASLTFLLGWFARRRWASRGHQQSIT